ncbi:ATP-binding protein [Kribbella sp. CA-253562]|uniref:ATP-binding protein n=1 Tax=Kribbella sp. CA-253562 TaxID=3239942 RepID=UPI003D900145
MRNSWAPACNARSPRANLTAARATSRRRFPAQQKPGGVRLRPRPGPQTRPNGAPGHPGLRRSKENVVFLGPPCPARPTWPSALASLIVASNKPFGRWGEVFGDVVVAAMIDRLVPHAEDVALKGDSLPTQGPRPGPRPSLVNRRTMTTKGATFNHWGPLSAAVDTRTAAGLCQLSTSFITPSAPEPQGSRSEPHRRHILIRS